MAAPCGHLNLVMFLFFTIVYQINAVTSCEEPSCVLVPLDASQTRPVEINVRAALEGRKLCVLCYPGQDRMWYKLWTNPKITIKKPNDATSLDFFYGQNMTEVIERSQLSSILAWSPFTWLKDEHSFDPFNISCIGIASESGYTVSFVVKNPEKWFVIYLALGLLLFFLAAPLSRNMYLQYGTGISVGVLGSLLLVVFILSRFLPQKLKNLGYVIAAVSTSASMYLYYQISSLLTHLMQQHWQILVGYVAVTGLVSFAVVYRHGPISNPRTLNLVRWALQLSGLVLIYQSSQIAEVSVAIIIVAWLAYLFPPGILVWMKKFRYRYFPSKTRLLTEEEYITEGEVETKKALEELRQFCRSPDCNVWRTISRLSSPNKFASFMEGSFHVSDVEYEDYSTLHTASLSNEDSEFEESQDES